jgi:hypothetical protein
MTTHRRSVAPTISFSDRPTIDWGTLPNAKKTQRTAKSLRDIQLPQSASGLTRDIPLGPYTQGLKLLYANSFGNGTVLYLVAAIGEGPVRSIIPAVNDVAMTLVSGSAINPSGSKYGTATGIECWVYDGSQNNFQETASGLQALDPTFVTTNADPNKGYNFLAYAVLKFTWPTVTEIGKITFSGEGYRDCFDSRTSTRGYTTNCALAIREVKTNTRWGLKLTSSQIDDVTYSTAANDCDVAVIPATPTSAATLANAGAGNVPTGTESYIYSCVDANGIETPTAQPASISIGTAAKVNVTLPAADSLTAKRVVYRSAVNQLAGYRKVGELAGNGGGTFQDNADATTWAAGVVPPTAFPQTTKRFEIGLLISTQTTAIDWLDTLRAHCVGVFTQDGGKYQLRINKVLPGGYTRAKFSEFHNWGGNNERPNVIARSIRWGRKRRRELFNEIEVQFTDAQNKFAPGSVVKQRASVAAGTEIPRRAVYRLPGILDSANAGRIATLLLNLAWDDAYFEFEADRTALAVLPWDVIALSGNGLSNQDVRVTAVRPTKTGTFVVRGNEYHDASNSDVLQGATRRSRRARSALRPAVFRRMFLAFSRRRMDFTSS